jgi:hypothetical protein
LVEVSTGSAAESLSYRSLFGKLIHHFLDESPSIYTSMISESRSISHVQADESSHPASSSSGLQLFLSPSYRSLGSEVVDDDMGNIVIAGKVIGKVLSIVALLLVFWVLTS